MRLLTLPRGWQIGESFRQHPALGVLLIVLVICALVNLVLAVGLPVNNWDSMTYHLSRVGYWIQHGSTDHFFTHNERQNFAPPNAEFGILSVVIFVRAEWPAPLGQYAAYFVCLAAVYFIARQLGASNAASLFAALLLGTMTEVILQATIPKNGLIVSSFLACSIGFALVGLSALRPALKGLTTEDTEVTERRKKRQARRFPPREVEVPQTVARLRALVWSALALGLAVGTKVTALLFLPGFVIAGLVVTITGGATDRVRRGALWAVFCACSVLVLGSFNSIRNYGDYGSIAGPKKTAKGVRLGKPTPRAVASNLARYGYHLCDFSGLVPQNLARGLTKARAAVAPPIFKGLGITLNAPELNVGDKPDVFAVDDKTGRFDPIPHLFEDTAWFGPVAFFVGLPLVVAHLVLSPLRKKWTRFAVALMPASYWLAVCAVLRYQLWGGRFFVTAAVAGAPLLALAYMPMRSRALKHFTTWLLTAVGVSTALTATFYNTSKPIVPKAAKEGELDPAKQHSVVSIARLRLRCASDPASYALLSIPQKHFPKRMRLGLVLGADDWDWPLFGPRLRRTLVPLPRESGRVATAFRDGEVDMVVIRKTIGLETMPPILGERPFIVRVESEINRLRANLWSFLFHRKEDANILFPARDWYFFPGFWIGADQRFVPVRELPAGRIVFPVKPNAAIIDETPLIFEFYAGDTKIRQVTLTDADRRAISIPWTSRPGPEQHVLRVRVTSPDSALDAELRKTTNVYQLVAPPRFEPDRAGGG